MYESSEFAPYSEAIARLEPLITRYAEVSDRQGHLASEVAQGMALAGLYRVAVPESIGGGEAHPLTQVQTIEAVSRIHGSTGWNLMIGIENMGILGAMYRRDVMQSLYADPGLIIAGSLNPLGKALREDGGYRISGQWPFASGVHNAQYFWGQSVIMENDVPLRDDKGPIFCESMIPADQFEIIETWDVSGLRGSGSHDVRVVDVFVPDRFISQAARTIPIESGTLYRLPLYSRLAYNKIGVATGIARAAIESFIALATQKKPRGSGKVLAMRSDAQRAVAEAERLLGSARSYAFEQIASLWDTVDKGSRPDARQKALLQLSCSGAANESVRAVDMLYSAAGASANFVSNPLERCMRDVLVVRQHIMVSPQYTEAIGRVLLGADSETFLF